MLATVLVVSVLVVLTQLMAAAQKSSDLASGSVIAERLMSEIVNRPSLVAGAQNQGFVLSNAQGDSTQFNYKTDVSHVDNSEYEVGTSFLVTVDVWWQVDNPDRQKAGVGKLATRLTRLVYRSEATPQP